MNKKKTRKSNDVEYITEYPFIPFLKSSWGSSPEPQIWVYFLAYNLIRLLMVQAALQTQKLPRKLSFKHSIQLWMVFNNHYDYFDYPKEKKSSLFALIAQRKIGNRPGRLEPRAIKRRPKPYPLLMKIRPVAQEEIRQNGHPKKLKLVPFDSDPIDFPRYTKHPSQSNNSRINFVNFLTFNHT